MDLGESSGSTNEIGSLYRPSVYRPTPYLNGPRHEYLKKCVENVNPRILSRVMTILMKHDRPSLRHREPPLLPLSEAAPNTFAPHIDRTRMCEIFGRRTAPKLRQDLDSANEEVVLMAIKAFGDLLHDPEKTCEAVREHLAEKLVVLMQHRDARIREQSCRVAETLAGQPAGRDELLEESNFIPTLQLVMLDPLPAVRYRAVSVMRVLGIFRLGAYDLPYEGIVAPFLLRILRWERNYEVIELELRTLKWFLTLDSTKRTCIFEGGFNLLFGFMKMDQHPEVAGSAMECLASLGSSSLGHWAGNQLGILSSPHLRRMLKSKSPEMQARGARLVMDFTRDADGKQAAIDAGLVELLVNVAMRPAVRGSQLCALQALANLAQSSSVRMLLLQMDDELEDLSVPDDDAEIVRQRLLQIVRSAP